jgi:hypothetical protein
MSWASHRYRDNAKKDAVLRDMSNHFLVMVFLPFHAAEIRQKIKYWGDTNGFMTQCIVSTSPPSESRRVMSLYLNFIASEGSELFEEQVQRPVF